MKYLTSILLSFSFVIIFFSACKKTEIEQMQTLNTDISGTVFKRITYYESEPFSNVKVQIENTDFSAITDNDGKYTIANVPSGVYNFIFSKEGYSIYKVFGKTIVGGGDYPYKLQSTYLYKISSIVASNLSVSFNNGNIKFSADYSNNNKSGGGVVVCISESNNVAFNNNLTVKLIGETPINTNFFFKENTTYYAVGYGYGNAFFSQYYDPQLESNVYTGLNKTPTNVVSFTIPNK